MSEIQPLSKFTHAFLDLQSNLNAVGGLVLEPWTTLSETAPTIFTRIRATTNITTSNILIVT